MFFKGDEVFVYTTDGGGCAGIISHITSKGVYLYTGGKKDKYFRADEIDRMVSHNWND
ncbi:hypothetical protein [Vallitalea sp.]|jgi:hypothetical protein|uniref:hypothetical protein n=1 Tax=Vallitalea sp. TaxID=1882829 RepID=UPI0025D5F112|nr:hypothetical protein [Vallitalea sp.]MCT4686063.1 hypothetical protein [Vallitalea sp.]